jgi:hypothetical protein
MADTQAPPATTLRSNNLLTTIRHKWEALDHVQHGLIGLAIARVVLALLFMLNVLPLELRWRWFLHHGGDQDISFWLAQTIIEGNPRTVLIGIGGALPMIPLILLLDPYNYFEIVAPLVVLNGFLLGGLSVLVVGHTAKRITQDDRVALWSAGIWSILPLLFYVGFFWHFDAVTVRSSLVPKIGWLNGLSDGPTMFFMMLAVMLLASNLESGQYKRTQFWRMVAVGAAMSYAVVYRVHIAPMVVFLTLYVLVSHGWLNLLFVGIGGIIAYIPQAWYNMVVFGIPITTGYSSKIDTDAFGSGAARPLIDRLRFLPFHPRHIGELLDYFLGSRPWLIIPLVAVILIGLAATILLWRKRGWHSVALLIGAPLSYIGLMATAWPFREDVVRFSMLCYPFLIILTCYTFFYLWDQRQVLGQRLSRRKTN